ncbi:hypothetical protein CWO84_13340 [Methylomonas sp. Kb3]|nr:hypothetical protein CWO84_13340 [Methylomonas sp. Kb3]
MVPSAFVVLDEMPLTVNGKFDRKRLPAPDMTEQLVKQYEPPRTEVEHVLVGIWQDLLGVERVGRNDDFFELGGHSLLAVQLISRLRTRLGIEIPLRILFTKSILRDFAIEIIDTIPRNQSNLVAIRPEGITCPLFMIHPRGGQIDYVRALAPWLSNDRPLYGLHAIGLIEGETPIAVMEDIATRYLHEIRSIQKIGPYCLAGYSSGGMIAYEIANQLIKCGEQVLYLGLIDTPAGYNIENYLDDFNECVVFERELISSGIVTNPEEVKEINMLSAFNEFNILLNYVRSRQLIPQDLDQETVKRYLKVCYTTDKALQEYAPKPISVPITLYAASDENNSFDIAIGWESVMGGNLKVVPIDGDHRTILDRPNIEWLGKAISEALACVN